MAFIFCLGVGISLTFLNFSMMEEQPSIDLFGLVFHTPVTALTDVVVALICLGAYLKLGKLDQGYRGEIYRLFRYYFLSMSLATFFGGILGHALLHYLPFIAKLPGWITSMLSVALLERALIRYASHTLSDQVGRFFSRLNILELLFFLVLSLVTVNFKFVLAHAGYGIGIVTGGFGLYIFLTEKDHGSKKMLQGVLACILGATCFVFKIGVSKWFNHVDVSHVFMMVASIFFYLGAKDLIIQSSQK
ncbi:MAG: hypothetical protein AAF789_00055 [Bacteroidota bacterium]